MGFLSWLMGRKDPEATLREAIEKLQVGLATNLMLNYSSRLKLESAGDHVDQNEIYYPSNRKPAGSDFNR